MAETKLTKKDYFAKIREIVIENPELVAFVDHEVELLTRKNSSKGMTATQKENEGIMNTIVDELVRIAKPVTISELQKESEVLATYSNQKLSALLKKLVDTERVVKVTDKKKTYFSVNA